MGIPSAKIPRQREMPAAVLDAFSSGVLLSRNVFAGIRGRPRLIRLGANPWRFPAHHWLITQYHKGSAPAVSAGIESRNRFSGTAISRHPARSTVYPFGGKQLVSSSQANPQVMRRDGFLEHLEARLSLKHIGVTQPPDKLAILNARP